MDPRRTVSPESALASDIFDKFCSANTLKSILIHYRHLCSSLRLKPTHFPDFYPRLKAKLSSWRAQALWSKFEKRASHKLYNRGKSCYGNRVLIIGAGPCGLRTAIEAQLLGAKVVVIEKRDRFSRNNVLHLWPSVIADLKALGAKKFYGKFCAGSIDHISIRQLQCILLKVALLLGVEVLEGVSFEGLLEPTENEGWRAKVAPVDHPVSHYNFDVLIGADGRRNTLDGFKRKALRAKLAIAITANFINKHTEAEARVKEISGVSYIFNQKFFQELNEATGIDLENIVYYKDETHYFVMTAKKQSLLNKGVLLEDHADTARLLSHDNISSEALMTYALEAAIFSTDNQLPNLDFAVNHYGQPDVAMFDFTAMYAAENACRVVQRKSHKLLMSLVGDSLLEPFWPTGSGCARGFLSSFDTCWMLRSWAGGSKSVLEVIAERESIYRLLGQTTPENLNKEHTSYTLDPSSRYPNLNTRAVMPFQVKSLYDSDEPQAAELVDGLEQLHPDVEKACKKRRRDSVIAVDSLLLWVRDQIAGYGLEVSDVCDAFNSGDVLCAIINRFRPDLIEFPLPSEENLDPFNISACHNQLAFNILQEEFGLPPVMSAFDSVQCTSSDFLAIVAYLSQVYEIFRGEIPQIKYPRVESEDFEECEQQRSSHSHPKQHSRPALLVKAGKSLNRRSRLSSSGRDGRSDGDCESSRKHKKRRSDDRSRLSVEERENRRQEIERNRLELQRRRMQERILQTERFIKSMRLLQLNDRSGEISVSAVDDNHSFEDYTFHLYRQMAPNFEDRCKYLERKLFYTGKEVKASCGFNPEKQNVPGLAKNLEEKLKGTKHIDKKPKDLIRSIGKIEKSDWNVQLIEKKIAENKSHCPSKDRDDKVPKWSREAFDDKREAMKRKMEGTGGDKSSGRVQHFEETMKKLGCKLKEGNTLEVGQRGANKVSQMAEKLVTKLERPKEEQVSVKTSAQRPTFEFPKRGGSENCHFCKERVYVVEKMTAEGKFFHRNCFRCEYCNTSLRLGNYVFDREGRYGERFYCSPHYGLIRMYGWKKYDQDAMSNVEDSKYNRQGSTLVSTSQQILSEMDERGTTPERVEFENSVDFASEEELLSEMDEEEWTDRNGFSNADNNTSDEASDLSDDDDITPEGAVADLNASFSEEPLDEEEPVRANKRPESSDSDTEVASGDESAEDDQSGEEDAEDEEEEDDEDEEEDDECEGSTTEIETDSEFAEDPPHSVPGKIPTIVVDEPEQLVTKIVDSTPLSHTQSPMNKHHHKANEKSGSKVKALAKPSEELVDVLQSRMVEPVKKNIPERALPRVNPVPKRWEPLSTNNDHQMASKLSLELKQRYLHGALPSMGVGCKRPVDSAAQNQFRSVVDKISEQQKLLEPASKPSATMQAFLEGAEKLKMKQTISPLSGNSPTVNIIAMNNGTHSPISANDSKWSSLCNEHKNDAPSYLPSDKKEGLNLITMNRLNLEKTREVNFNEAEKGDHEKEVINSDEALLSNVPDVILNAPESKLFTRGDFSSVSQSETDTQSTIIGTNKANQISILGESVASIPDKNGDHQKSSSPASDPVADEESETESAESLSDSDDIDADIEDDCNRIQHDPPRVEIEDEFGVSLKVDDDYACTESENLQELQDPLRNLPCHRLDEDVGRSVGMSSSDSKDSLNSGMFLETEMSDWTRDTEAEGAHGLGRKKKKKSKSEQLQKIGYLADEASEKHHILKSNLILDLANLDFADVDGISSPEDVAYVPKRYGYCKLADEDCESDCGDVPAQDMEVVTENNFYSSSRESTPTVGSVQETGNQSAGEKFNHSPGVIQALNHVVISEQTHATKELVGCSPKNDQSKIVVLDRVVPFSNARDSLDYRKMKNAPSPSKSKDLFSSFARAEGNTSFSGYRSEQPASPDPIIKKIFERENYNNHGSSDSKSISSKGDLVADNTVSDPSTSPNTARKIEEINKERVKQSDLIRSMVIGRILRSPDKNRRSSRGSMSPLNTSSSSTSGSSEHVVKPQEQFVSLGSSNSPTVSTKSVPVSEANIEGNTASTTIKAKLSTDEKTPENLDPSTFTKDFSQKPDDYNPVSKSNILHHYEPVFTSSPRFRNRPKFDTPFSLYGSVTNPPTPVNPSAYSFTPVTPELNMPLNEVEYPESQKRNKSPSFYRSMPDLSAFLTPSNDFSNQTTKRWELYKNNSTVDREKARQAARERARLKSDQELGLDQTDYVVYKDKLRRKISVPEDDVFNPSAAVVVSSIRHSGADTPSNETSSFFVPSRNGTALNRSSADFSAAKTNPFVVSPGKNVNPENPDKKSELFTVEPRIAADNPSESDDFVHLKLRINPKQHPSERKVSPEKCKSMGWDMGTYSNYFTPFSPQSASISSTHSDPNRQFDSNDCRRPRSNTLSETVGHQDANSGNSHNIVSLAPNASAIICAPAVSSRADSPVKPIPRQSKALSSDMLLDDSPLSSACGDPSRGASVPDVTRDPCSPERRSKKPKDRERRRSIIQAVSDFFSSRSSTSIGNSPSNSVSPPELQKTNGTPGSSKDKFSLFKLTPKILHKDRRTSKSRETLTPRSHGQTESMPPAKPPRVGLASYLSQPDMVIQRLSSSPTPFKSNRTVFDSPPGSRSLPARDYPLGASSPGWFTGAESAGDESLRMNIQDIQSQLDKIETDQSRLERHGISIEKKLKGEERDELNRDEAEIMEEWFTFVREKTRLNRLEKELTVKVQALELEGRQNIIHEKLNQSGFFSDIPKTPDQKAYEEELLTELHAMEQQKDNLLFKYHEDVRMYDREDADLEEQIASSSILPRESNV